MKYTNIILTIIAVLLALHLAVRMVKPVMAGSGGSNVDIVSIAGYKLFEKAIPVKVVE